MISYRSVFEVLLNFIRTGKVPALEPQMAKALLLAAHQDRMEELKSIVEDYLCDQLSLESAASLQSLAEAAKASKLKEKCLELINSHSSPSTTPPIAPLSPFAHLPDLCLLALFRELPPADQISARKTCHRWSVLVPVTNKPHARSITIVFNRFLDDAEELFNRLSHGRHWKLLKLLQKENGSPLVSIRHLTKWNSLQLSTLDEETASQIMATFPVVKELQLCCVVNTPPPDLLVRLLEQWRSQLTTFNLIVDISSHSNRLFTASFNRLGTAISSLPALKHLSIKLSSNGEQFLLDLPLQLTQLNANALTRISFGDYSNAHQLASLSHHLRQRVVRLDTVKHSDYRTICNHFHSLTSVVFHFKNTPLPDFLTHASQLTELIHLRLYIGIYNTPPEDEHRPLPQLKSVKLLSLHFLCQQSHRDLEQLKLSWTMPNLQLINFEISHRCTTCGISYRSTPDIDRAKQCLYQMFVPLKRHCDYLRTIKHNFEERFGTAEELLAEQSAAEADLGVSRLEAQV